MAQNSYLGLNRKIAKLLLKDLDSTFRLTQDEVNVLCIEAQNGSKKAIDTLVRANYKWVLKIALRQCKSPEDMMDIFNEGVIGLIEAIHNFKPAKGFRFSTYSVWWIRRYIGFYYTTCGREIRVPGNLNLAIMKYRKELKTKPELRNQNQEIIIEEFCKKNKITKELFLDALYTRIGVLSLDWKDPTGEDGESRSLHEMLPNNVENPDNFFSTVEKKELIQKSLKKLLSKQELFIVKNYYGLDETPSQIYEELGTSLNISRERIRQVLNIAKDVLKKDKILNEIS